MGEVSASRYGFRIQKRKIKNMSFWLYISNKNNIDRKGFEKKAKKNFAILKLFLIIGLVLYFLTFSPMKKQDFIKSVAAKAGLSQDAVAKSLGAMIEVITKSLKKGEEVNVTGFGAWKVSNRAARNGVNPKTGAKIKIPAMKTPVFRAGKTLKEAVR